MIGESQEDKAMGIGNVFEDTMLNEWVEKVRGREMVETEIMDGQEVITWTREQFMDFAGWTESRFKSQSNAARQSALEKKGVHLISASGRGENFTMKVSFTGAAWYHILLRRGYRHSDVATAYLDWMFQSNGKVASNGVELAATIKEVAAELSEKLGVTALAVEKRIDRLRAVMKPYGYIYKGEGRTEKTHRVKKIGCSEYVTGSEAILYDNLIRMEWKLFFSELNRDFPLFDGMDATARVKNLSERESRISDFYTKMLDEHKLGYVRTQRISIASREAVIDKEAIIFLWRLGATFTEINEFLEKRPEFWKQVHSKEEEVK